MVLTTNSLGFDDKALLLNFTGLEDSDIDHYTVYVSTAAFEATDYLGGPPFEGADALVAPIVIENPGPGMAVSQRIEPLTNDVTYYVAVRATDSGGLEGPMSEVINERPRPSFNASGMTNDPGGFRCSSLSAVRA